VKAKAKPTAAPGWVRWRVRPATSTLLPQHLLVLPLLPLL
jgi:hypothetical protein